MFGLVEVLACVAVGVCVLHCLWRPIRFVLFTGLGIVAIVAGIRMLAPEHGPIAVHHLPRAVAGEVRERNELRNSPRISVNPGVRVEHGESLIPNITVEPEIEIDHDLRFDRIGRAFHFHDDDDARGIAGETSTIGKIALAAMLLIVGWLLVGGGKRPGMLKAFTLLGLAVGGVVLVHLFTSPRHVAVHSRDRVVRNVDRDSMTVSPPERPSTPQRPKPAKRITRAKRPANRPDREESSEELLAQMPKRAGEIPVDAELAKSADKPASPQPAEASEPANVVSEPAAPATPVEPAAPSIPSEPAQPSEPPAPAERAAKPEPTTVAPTEPAPQPSEPSKQPAAVEEPSETAAPVAPQEGSAPTPVAAPPSTPPSTPAPAAATPAATPPALLPANTTPASTAATPAANRPNWIDAPGRLEDTVYRVSVKSGPWVSVAECQRALDTAIKHETDQYIDELLGEPGASKLVNVSRNYLREHVKKAEYNEIVQASVGPMHQIYALLEYDDEARAVFHQKWRNAVVGERLIYAGTGAAALLALLGTLYGYLRLDLKTGGAHKGRLQLAATLVALIVAATALLVRWVE